jgi:hypothetical protein
MPKQIKVECYLCGSIFEVEEILEAQEDCCQAVSTMYYCEKCSERKADLTCSNCGKVFQGLPVMAKAGDPETGVFCEECTNRMIEAASAE